MRLAVFLVTMLTLVSFTGCLDGLTSEDIQEVKPGCTYAEAENYDPMAQIDDGSCIIKEPVAGCTYEDAENYNQIPNFLSLYGDEIIIYFDKINEKRKRRRSRNVCYSRKKTNGKK